MNVTVQNVGFGTLTGIASTSPPFSITAGSPFNVSSNQIQAVTVHFAPATEGTFTQTVNVSSNGGTSRVGVTGKAFRTTKLLSGKISFGTAPLTGVPVLRLCGIVITPSCPRPFTRQETVITDSGGNYFFTSFSVGDYLMPVSSGILGEVGDTNLGPHGYLLVPEFCQVGSPNQGRRCAGNQTTLAQNFSAAAKPTPLDPPITFKLPLPSGNWYVVTEAGGYVIARGQVDADPSHTDLSTGFYAIDFASPCGTPALAVADGIVVDRVADHPNSSWGNTIVLQHPTMGNILPVMRT